MYERVFMYVVLHTGMPEGTHSTLFHVVWTVTEILRESDAIP